jgi:hypothetical protein
VTWFKVDDKLHEHKKVRRMEHDLAAIGLWTLSGSWAGGERTDGFVPASIPRRWASPQKIAGLAARLVDAGLWEPAEVDGERGWLFHDWEQCNPTKDDTATDAGRLRWRRKNALSKNRDLCERIVARDRSMCRYDHVDPDGPNSFENVVVACRRCNGRKRDRTPTEAGMTLLPEPGPWEPTPESEKVPDVSGSDLASPTRDGAESGPGRVGTGSELGRVPAPVVEVGS